tara:strand:- start:14681 stop:15088 length:408 start_codon:yes stop_codon:yes gene_type:complete
MNINKDKTNNSPAPVTNQSANIQSVFNSKNRKKERVKDSETGTVSEVWEDAKGWNPNVVNVKNTDVNRPLPATISSDIMKQWTVDHGICVVKDATYSLVRKRHLHQQDDKGKLNMNVKICTIGEYRPMRQSDIMV